MLHLFFFFPLLVHERQGNALGKLARKQGDQFRPFGYYSQQLDSVAKIPLSLPPEVLAVTTMLRADIEELVFGFPLTESVLRVVKALLESHHTQHLSVNRQISYEILIVSTSCYYF